MRAARRSRRLAQPSLGEEPRRKSRTPAPAARDAAHARRRERAAVAQVEEQLAAARLVIAAATGEAASAGTAVKAEGTPRNRRFKEPRKGERAGMRGRDENGAVVAPPHRRRRRPVER